MESVAPRAQLVPRDPPRGFLRRTARARRLLKLGEVGAAMKPGKSVQPPPQYELAIFEACDGDRVYFERHPEVRQRWRAAVCGEFWPVMVVPETFVEVTQVVPGVRVRRPYTVVGGET